jgi:hypothetical protein
MNSDTIVEILKSKGKISLYEYNKFKSQSTQLNEKVYEYLYLCKVGKKGKLNTINLLRKEIKIFIGIKYIIKFF